MQVMRWDDLQFFLAVARTGLLASAARQLDVDATTVGRRIRRLEQALGQTLFEQGRDGHNLTEAGRKLLVQVEAIDRATTAIGGQEGEEVRGRLRISASEGFGTWLIAHHLGQFAVDHPGISIDLAANSGFLDPSRREADVAILLGRPQRGPLISKKLTDYALRLYAGHGYLAVAPPLENVGDLRHQALVGYIPDLLYSPELRYMDEVLPGLEPRIRSSSINAQYRLIASGAGVGVLPCFIGDRDPLVARVLPDIRILRSFWLVTHQDTRHLPRNSRFVEWLSTLVQQRRDWLLGDGGGQTANKMPT
jgi:DNA-binding transcriptional LysR family regulator